jgi:curved DNA-binding protein
MTHSSRHRKDYYEVLGVLPTATLEEIEAAFRTLARKYHPDLRPNDKSAETRFKEVNEAHEVLADPEKRRCYDQSTARGRHHPSFTVEFAREEMPAFCEPGDQVGLELFLNELNDFLEASPAQRATSHRSTPRRSYLDIEAELTLTPEESQHGGLCEFSLKTAPGRSRLLRIRIPPGMHNGSILQVPGEGAVERRTGRRGDLYLHVRVQLGW